MAYLLQFGDYEFESTLRPDTESSGQDSAPVNRPRVAGAATQIGRRETTILRVVGEITADTADELYTKEAELKGAIYNGKQDFYFGRDDIYYQDVQLKSYSCSAREGLTHGIVHFYTLTFEAADYPFPVSANLTLAGLSASSGSLLNSGAVDVFPEWSIGIYGAGDGPITLTNTTTGESAVLDATFAHNDQIILNAATYKVYLNGDESFNIFQGRIPRLRPGYNDMTVTLDGTATIGYPISYEYRQVYG